MPVPPQDLLHALPGLLLWAIVPGILATSALMPALDWSLRITAAPAVSCGVLGLLGLFTHATSIPYSPPIGFAFLGLLLVAAVLSYRNSSHSSVKALANGGGSTSRDQIAFTACTALAGAISVATLILSFRGVPLPVWDDPAFHAMVAHTIAHTGDAIPPLYIPAEGPGAAAIRPQMGLEATAALIAGTFHLGVAGTLLPITALSIAVLPLGIGSLTRELTESPITGGIASLLSLGFGLPSFFIAFGDFPLVVDSLLVVPAVVTALRWTHSGNFRYLALSWLMCASAWIIHGTELFTIALILLPFGVSLISKGPQLHRVVRLSAIPILVLLTHLLFSELSHPMHQLAHIAASGKSVPFSTTEPLGHLTLEQILVGFFKAAFINPGILILYLAGLPVAFFHPKLRWLLVAQAFSLLILIDRNSTHFLAWVWTRTSVWSESDRLISLQWFFVPVVAAAPALFKAGAWSRVKFGAAARRAVVVVGSGLALTTLSLGTQVEWLRYQSAIANHDVVSHADLEVIKQLANVLPAGSVVLNDGQNDAGKWIPALTDELLYLPKPASNRDDAHLIALQEACTNPSSAEQALTAVRAVFVGDRLDPDAVHPWNLACIRKLPALALVTSQTSRWGTAAAFIVRRHD